MSQPKSKKSDLKKPRHQQRQPPLRVNSEGHAEPAVTHMHHAAVHQLFIQAPIFRPIQKGARNTPWECTGRHKRDGNEATYQFNGPQLLDIFDQTVFLHLTRRSGVPSTIMAKNTEKQWSHVVNWLKMTAFTLGDQAACIVVSPSDLIRDQHRSPDEKGKKAVLASLQRLAATTVSRVIYGIDGKPANTNRYQLIGIFERDDDELAVILNPESASRSKNKVGVAWISMQEQAALKQEAARRLHAWLSTALHKHEKRSFSLDNVIKHVWAAAPDSPERRKDLKRTLKSALAEVGGLPGWYCVLAADGKNVEAYKPVFVGTRGKNQKSTTLDQKSTTTTPISTTSKRKSPTEPESKATPGLAMEAFEPSL